MTYRVHTKHIRWYIVQLDDMWILNEYEAIIQFIVKNIFIQYINKFKSNLMCSYVKSKKSLKMRVQGCSGHV